MITVVRAARLCFALSLPLVLAVPGRIVHAGQAATRPRAIVTVTIQNYAFSPAMLTVKPGTTVIWTNRDSVAHTVTSNAAAWPPSGPITTGQHFSHTFSTPGVFAYHCSIHTHMMGTVMVATGRGMGGGMSMMGSMGPMSMRSITTFTGWYDKHKVLFLATDTSSKSEALREHINFAARLAASLPHAVPMYMVTNGAFATYGAVFGSQPGEDDYTPLWQEVLVTWKTPSQAVALGRDDQIKDLARTGKVTLRMTGVVLNCPIIKVMGAS